MAWGGEAELEVERGWVEIERESAAAARVRALDVLATNPGHAGARELFLEASAAAGWGATGVAEMSGEPTAPPWSAAVASLEGHLQDKAALKVDVANLVATYPDEPDLLAPLWSVDTGPAVAIRAKWVAKAAPASWSEEATLRWLRLARGVDAPALHQEAKARADAAGFAPSREVLDRPALRDLGQAWSEQPPTAPFVYPSELPVAGGHLDEIWTKAARWAELETFWTWAATVSTDGLPQDRIAQARLHAGRLDEARSAAEQAMEHTGAPTPYDQLSLGSGRLRDAFAQILHTRAEVAEAQGDLVTARGDLGTAVLLAESQVDPHLGDRLQHLVPGVEAQLEPRYRGKNATASQIAMGRIAGTVDAAATADAALAIVRDARLLAFTGTGVGGVLATDPEAWYDVVGDTWFFEGRAHLAAGRPASARAALVLATLFLPDDAEVWEARARAHAALGEDTAAFGALAMARGRGTTGLDDRLAAAYHGPGDWKVVATMLGGAPPEVVAPPRVRGVARPGGGRWAGAGPKLGKPFPRLAFEGGSTAQLGGRVVVVSAFRSDCEECLQLLPSYSRLASRLRAKSIDMVVIAVNTDSDPASAAAASEMAQNWGQLAVGPELEGQLGIRRYPTTWVIDREGNTSYFVDHWLSSSELEQVVRNTP